MGKKNPVANEVSSPLPPGRNQRRRSADGVSNVADMTPEGQPVLFPEAARRILNEMQIQKNQLDLLNDELRRTQAAVEASQARYFDFYNVAPVGYLTITSKGMILEANLTMATFLQVARELVIRQSFTRFIIAEDHDKYHFHIKQLFAAGASEACELRLGRKGGGQLWVQMETILVRDAENATLCHAVLSDITQRKQAEEVVRCSEIRYRALMEQSFEGLALADVQTQEVVEVNRRFTEMTGYSLPADAPLFVNQFIVDTQENLNQLYNERLKQQKVVEPEPRILRHKNGAEIYVERAGTVICLDGRDYLLGSMRDVTMDRRHQAELSASMEKIKLQQEILQKANALLVESQQALAHQATHDSLTGLLNRRAALELLSKEMVRSKRHGERLAVGMLDIDDFKGVNDTLGHLAGDEVLFQASELLAASVREYDIVARIGGEEFLIILPLRDGANADSIFERLCTNIADSRLETRSGKVSITVSIGMAYLSADSDMDKLLADADTALYIAKARGRNCVVCAE